MELEWSDNSDNEFWVVIERCTGANCTDFVSVGTTRGENAVSYRDRTVAAGTTYTYRVKAVGSAGSSPYSNTAVGTTSVKTPPAAPSDLTAAVTGETITLKWSDNSSNALQFPIERCEGVGCSTFTQINAVDDNITEFVDYDAEPGRTYSYRVRAWNSGGYSGYSNVATAGDKPPPPLAPTQLQATAVSSTAIKLRWVNSASTQDGIVIERCKGSGCTTFTKVATVPGTATTYKNGGLRSRTIYTYRIRSFNTGGFSPYTNPAAAKTQ
jgi:fibronectin type 3 domain-containing protein